MEHFRLTFLIAKLLLLLAAIPARSAEQAPRPPQAPPVQVAAVPKAKAGCDCQTTGFCICGDDCPCAASAYTAARRRAIQHGKPLVVWVQTTPCKDCIPDAEHCVVHAFPGVSGKGIVVGVPDGAGSLDRVASLPETSTMQSVAAAAKGAVASSCASCASGSCASGSCSTGSSEGGGCSSGSCGGSSSRGFGFFRRR